MRNLLQSPRRLLWLSTVVVLLVQTILFTRSATIHGFATGDGGVKLWQVQGILRAGDLNAPLDYPGAVYDPDHQYAPFVEPWAFWKDGKFYSEYTSPLSPQELTNGESGDRRWLAAAVSALQFEAR